MLSTFYRNVPGSLLVLLSVSFSGISAEIKPNHTLTGALVRTWARFPFFSAPMTRSPRSIVVLVETNLHVAFDAHWLRVHAIWKGEPLPFRGQQYDGNTQQTIFEPPTPPLWTMPQTATWSWGPPGTNALIPLPEGADFRGITHRTNAVSLTFTLGIEKGKEVLVRESFGSLQVDSVEAVLRRFEISPHKKELWCLAHAEFGRFLEMPHGLSAVAIQRSNDVLLAVALEGEWKTEERFVSYSEEVITDPTSPTLPSVMTTTGWQSRAWIKLPEWNHLRQMKIATAILKNSSQLAGVAGELHRQLRAENHQTSMDAEKNRSKEPLCFAGSTHLISKPAGDEFYRIEQFPVPPELDFLVGGMDWLPNGDLAVCTWPGDVYIVQGATGAVKQATYRRFASGLHEPLGLKVLKGQIVVAQKTELTRLLDTDHDGEADQYQTINNDWGFSGNHHSFAYGPALDRHGNFYVTLDGNSAFWETPYRGWVVQISPDGKKLNPFSSGLRSPNGFLAYGENRDIFFTDNEGHWIPTCKVSHARQGNFYGYPSSMPFPRQQVGQQTNFTAPALWLPRKLSHSASGLETITGPRFGPFEGQMLIGDFGHGTVLRASLEKVKGEWQGAVWPFLKGFASGVNRLSMGPDGHLYAGCLRRAWSSSNPRDFSLERVSFRSLPFEMKEIRALKDGFLIHFTEAINPETVVDPLSIEVSQFGYHYHSAYGSPEIDHQGRENRSTPITVKSMETGPDGKTLRLKLEGLRPGFVTSIRTAELKSRSGKKLRNDTAHYTLNQMPD